MLYPSLFADEDSLLYYGCYTSDIFVLGWFVDSGEKGTIEECLSECRASRMILGAMRVGVQQLII